MDRDEIYRRITNKLRFPLLDAEMEEILKVIEEELAPVWDQGYTQGYSNGCGYDIYPKQTIGNPYKEKND